MSEPNSEALIDDGMEMAPESGGGAAYQEPSVYRKQSMNIYTVMLLISLVCLIVAIIVLSIEMTRWGSLPFPYRTTDAVPNIRGLLNLPFFSGI